MARQKTTARKAEEQARNSLRVREQRRTRERRRWLDARLRGDALDPGADGRRAGRRRRGAVPGAAPDGAARLGRGRVGAVGEQPQGQVLPPDITRPEAADGAGALDPALCHGTAESPGSRDCVRGPG